jgi:hypothetical protein
MPGCNAYVTPDLVAVPAATSGAVWSGAIPNQPSLLGTQRLVQALSLDPGSNAAGLTASNAAAGTLGYPAPRTTGVRAAAKARPGAGFGSMRRVAGGISPATFLEGVTSMRIRPLVCASTLLCASLFAQNCPERNLGAVLGLGDDTVFGIQPIGFTFPFGGSTYTDVHVCANGYVTLSNAGVPAPPAGDYTSSANELVAGAPRLCVLWHDLNLLAANNAGAYIDSTANRCTITWDNAVNFGQTTRFQLQLQLFPTGEIRTFWSAAATNDSTFNSAAGAGLCGVSPGGGAALPVPTDLSQTNQTVDHTIYETWPVQGQFDLAGRSMTLIPTSPGWVQLTTPWSNCAESTDFGAGCIGAADSFYERMSPAGFDLSGTAWRLQRTTSGYQASSSTATFVAPSGTAAVIANGDDVSQSVQLAQAMPVPGGTTSQLAVSSNGQIALANIGNGAGFAPDPGNFLDYGQTAIAAAWHDYNPAIAGSGKVLFEQVGTTAYVTWNDVYTYGTTSADRFQFQFDLASGNITVVYDLMAPAGNPYLVGYSRGGLSPRPDQADLSVDLVAGIAVADTAVIGLRLSTAGAPLLGNTQFAYTVANVPNVLPLAFLFFGDQPAPGIDLTLLGLPGCRGYTNANLTSATIPVALPAGTATQLLPIPTSTSLAGALLVTQAVAFSLQTPLNLVTSNGNRATIGL